MVMRFLLVAVGPTDADDVFQEAFLAALRAYPRCDDPTRLDRWALTIASRKAIDHHRARARRPIPVQDVPDRAGAPPPDVDDELWAEVGALPPKQRVAIVHRHVLDRPYAEIAAIMGSTEEAARANVHAGMKRLRERVR
jgi:RNA polymerase sigma factor (sigma-70 family)